MISNSFKSNKPKYLFNVTTKKLELAKVNNDLYKLKKIMNNNIISNLM